MKNPLTYSCSFAQGNCDALECSAQFHQGGRTLSFSMVRAGTARDAPPKTATNGLPDCFTPHNNFDMVGMMQAPSPAEANLTDGQMVVDAEQYRKATGESPVACMDDLDWARFRVWMIDGREGYSTTVSVADLMGQKAMMIYETEICDGAEPPPRQRFHVALSVHGMSVHVERKTKACPR